jgi:hypothetical protein
MTSIIPINEYEIAQIIFEYSEDIPNDFYVHIMNLVKLYYENGNNLQEIHVYIEENKNRINQNILLKIKKSLEPKHKFIIKISCDCCSCYNFFKGLVWIIILLFIILGFITVIVLNLLKK